MRAIEAAIGLGAIAIALWTYGPPELHQWILGAAAAISGTLILVAASR